MAVTTTPNWDGTGNDRFEIVYSDSVGTFNHTFDTTSPTLFTPSATLPFGVGREFGVNLSTAVIDIDNFQVSVIPEPSTLLLSGLGALLLGLFARRRR